MAVAEVMERICEGLSNSHYDVDGLHAQTICCRDGKFRRLLAHIGYVFQFLHGVLVDGTVFVVVVIVEEGVFAQHRGCDAHMCAVGMDLPKTADGVKERPLVVSSPILGDIDAWKGGLPQRRFTVRSETGEDAGALLLAPGSEVEGEGQVVVQMDGLGCVGTCEGRLVARFFPAENNYVRRQVGKEVYSRLVVGIESGRKDDDLLVLIFVVEKTPDALAIGFEKLAVTVDEKGFATGFNRVDKLPYLDVMAFKELTATGMDQTVPGIARVY